LRIAVSARTLQMPSLCACCGGQPSTTVRASATRVRGVRAIKTESNAWDIPYCARCAGHARTWPRTEAGAVFLLTLLTFGIYLIYYLHQRDAARRACSANCAGPGWAAHYLGWHGTRHEFDLAARSFARAFMAKNRGKLAFVDAEAQAILDAGEPTAPPSPARRPQAEVVVPRESAPPRQPAPPPPPAPPRAPSVLVETASPSRSDGTSRFFGPGTVVDIAGRRLVAPLVYIGSTMSGADASTVMAKLPVGRAESAAPLPYWPSYYEASPDQRAHYLDWLASGRRSEVSDVGYVFIFFYGLERRALIDAQDREVVVAELKQLLECYGPGKSSFRGYAGGLLTFLALSQLEGMSEVELLERLGNLEGHQMALSAVLAWYSQRAKPLPAKCAAATASSMEGAKRGVVVQRAVEEMADLFSIRYREKYGDGLVPVAAKRNTTHEYHPGSQTLARSGARLSVKIPDVLGRSSQFQPLVQMWNGCVEDLKKLSSSKRKDGATPNLTAQAWASLPPELRAEYEHPERQRWDALVAAAPVVDGYPIMKARELGVLAGLEVGDKYTAAQMKKIADVACELGFALEPEPRILNRAVAGETEIAVWRSENAACPDPNVYQAAYGLLALGLSVAMADGAVSGEESKVVTKIVEEMVPVDEILRSRLEALRAVLARQPERIAAIARKLQGSKTPEQRSKIGRVLVLVAAADGVLADGEHKSLRSVYKALGLPAAELAAAIVGCNLRLASDAPVVVQRGAPAEPGDAIPPPPDARSPKAPLLDQNAIASIMAETREVASMLSEVLSSDEDDVDQAARSPAVPPSNGVSTQPASDLGEAATRLDPRYHAALRELITKPAWTSIEVRELGGRLKLMPGGIFEALNSWSDEHYGEYLIDDEGDWHVRIDLLGRPQG
jgi:tellurite resistance protein